MRTDELIVELARAARPVRPLPAPSVRLAQWAAGAVPIAALGVALVGPRANILTAMHQPIFQALAAVTLATALLAAASAFVLSVPGAERSPVQRVAPIAAWMVWTAGLVLLLNSGGDPVRRVAAWPIHWACIVEIVGVGVLTGWPLFAMLRRAAPLRLAWCAALATLAAAALAATATQVICPIDDPAHQLVGHLLPVVVVSACGAVAGRRWLRA